MRLNREVEETMTRLFRQNKIVGGLYSSLGQEAISVGTAYALEKRDWMAPMIRNIGALLVKGVPPRDIFTQHMAKYTSPTKGRDGTSHFGDLDNLHIVSPISMLGDLIPVMTGVGHPGKVPWAEDCDHDLDRRWRQLDGCVSRGAEFCGVAESAVCADPGEQSVGVLHAGCRGRCRWRIWRTARRPTASPATLVDGNDVVEVYTTAKEAVERARAGEGPILIERRLSGGADTRSTIPRNTFHGAARILGEARPDCVVRSLLLKEKLLDAKGKKEMEGN